MPSPERVLVLDGQTTQGLACVRSLGRAGHTVYVASPLRRPLAAWSRYCRAHVRLDETIAGFAALRAWARRQGVGIVLPQRERSCLLCDAEREQWEAAGIVLGCGPEDMLLRAFDKARTLELAVACGMRIPPTRFPRTLAEAHAAAEAIGYPCILKPRFSDFWDGGRFQADHGARYVPNPAALEAAVAACRRGEAWPLIQAIVPGRGKGVFALCDRGEPVAWFGHERLRDVRPSGSGSSLRRSIPLDPRLREPAGRLLAAMAWHGPVMVEFRDNGAGEPCLIEVNGRFWGSLELAVASGVDFPALWVALLRGERVAATTAYETGVTVRWAWGDVKRLLYVVAGAPPGCPEPYPSVLQGLREVLGPQPAGTRSETWRPDDRWPGVGEWMQGIGGLGGVFRTTFARALRRAPPAAPPPPPRLADIPKRATPAPGSHAAEVMRP